MTVAINVANFIIQPPGGANEAATGHIHYYRDVPPTDPTKGAVTPADALGVTYKAVQTSTVTWDNMTARVAHLQRTIGQQRPQAVRPAHQRHRDGHG